MYERESTNKTLQSLTVYIIFPHQHKQPRHDLILSSQIFDFPCCCGLMGGVDKESERSGIRVKGTGVFIAYFRAWWKLYALTHTHLDDFHLTFFPVFSSARREFKLFSCFGENGGAKEEKGLSFFCKQNLRIEQHKRNERPTNALDVTHKHCCTWFEQRKCKLVQTFCCHWLVWAIFMTQIFCDVENNFPRGCRRASERRGVHSLFIGLVEQRMVPAK